MTIITIIAGEIEPGVALANDNGQTAVVVGESGRGRSLGVLPVINAPQAACPRRSTRYASDNTNCPACGCAVSVSDGHCDHPADAGLVPGRPAFGAIKYGPVGPYLDASVAEADGRALVVFRTPVGNRGGNAHTGASCGWRCPVCGETGHGEPPELCTPCVARELAELRSKTPDHTGELKDIMYKMSQRPIPNYLPIPGEVIVRGRIAMGDAGRVASGEQLMVRFEAGSIFRVAVKTGTTRPDEWVYSWDGAKLRHL